MAAAILIKAAAEGDEKASGLYGQNSASLVFTLEMIIACPHAASAKIMFRGARRNRRELTGQVFSVE